MQHQNPSPDLTSLYLIDGKRVVPRSLRLTVAELDRRFVEEDPDDLPSGDFHLPDAWKEGNEVWLWLDNTVGREIGFAAFPMSRIPGDSSHFLFRLWLAPEYRRKGLLSKAWETWNERYGDGLEVSESNAAMSAFLERQEALAR